jgi:hypothetical protein
MASTDDETNTGDGIIFVKGRHGEAPGLDLKVLQLDKGSRACLKSMMLAANIAKIYITSASRDAIGQASVMYDNLLAGNPAAGGASQQAVAQVYEEHAGEPADAVITAMTNKINELGPQNVSKHCRLPLFITTIDIAAGKMTGDEQIAFRNAVRAQLGGLRVKGFGHPLTVTPPEFHDPAFHIEMLTDAEIARINATKGMINSIDDD